MRIYESLSQEQKNKMATAWERKFKSRFPIGTELRSFTVIGYERMRETSQDRCYWHLRCRCLCGRVSVVRPSQITGKGRSESCGCVGIRKRTEAAMRVWKLPPGEAAARSAFSNFKAQANCRGIETVLTIAQFKEITADNCRYCGATPSQVYGSTARIKPRLNGVFIHNGIDRVDSSKRYTQENCVACCKHCNYAKNKMTEEEFKTWLRRAATHFLGMC